MLYQKERTASGELNDGAAELLGEIVCNFYRARSIFHDKYDRTVRAHYGRNSGGLDAKLVVDQPAISLEKVKTLIDEVLFPLKEDSHMLFQDGGKRLPFDRYVSDIFHEVSKLREDTYELVQIGESTESVERSVVSSIKHDIKPLMRRVYKLFEQAEEELMSIMRQNNASRPWIRSLYCSREDVFHKDPTRHLEAIYRKVYDYGVPEGYLAVAESFAKSGFYDHAAVALDKAKKTLKPRSKKCKAALHAHIRETEKSIEKKTLFRNQ